jgi:hypothetical protein
MPGLCRRRRSMTVGEIATFRRRFAKVIRFSVDLRGARPKNDGKIFKWQ